MKNISSLKLLIFSLTLIIVSASTTYLVIGTTSKNGTKVSSPQNNCEIRNWYNFQVIAIPKLNKYWVEQGISLEERSKKAFMLRHEARKNARYMMQNKEEIEALQQRDQEKYGNPDGPTFEYLLAKSQKEGKNEAETYQSIIEVV